MKLTAGFGINSEKRNFGKNKMRNRFSYAMNLISEIRVIFCFVVACTKTFSVAYTKTQTQGNRFFSLRYYEKIIEQ